MTSDKATDKAMDGLKMKLQAAYKASGGKKVNVVSHSMGGLLVKCFMSLHADVFKKYINKGICIACPFQGAPGCINDSLLMGLQFVYGFESFFFVSRWNMHQLEDTTGRVPGLVEMFKLTNTKKNGSFISDDAKKLMDPESSGTCYIYVSIIKFFQ